MHVVRDNSSNEVKQVINEDNKPIIKDLLLLTKTSDNKIRQIILTKDQMQILLRVLVETSKDKFIKISEETIKGVTWESNTDLTK